MRIGRLNDLGRERPFVVVDGEAVTVDHIIGDWTRTDLERGALEMVRDADLSDRPRLSLDDLRPAAPILRPGKVVCVGLNYAQHAAEIGAASPAEPIIFMKSPDAVVGAHEDVIIPPGSERTDYEAELAIVIGRQALYLESPASVRGLVLGYSISQDISERAWQMERGGQWVKGKSFPTFNPIGPIIVTPEEFDPADARVWCSVDGEMRQESRTSDMFFQVDHLVWYISQFMELCAGDIINTGTPAGVGMGMKPPGYLRPGQELRTGIEGIGELVSCTVAADPSTSG
jgi:2-keto-4-pentenoate hydratase/2-oxohepta-3-ene-1,7-dioic acid hydratase in catechol pathway